MSGVIEAYLMSFFLVLFAFGFLYVASKETKDIKNLLIVVAIAYIFLAHIGVMVGLGISTEEAVSAPCENVINTTTTSGNTTTYTYMDSCMNETSQPGIDSLFTMFGFLVVLIGSSILFFIIWFVWRWLQSF